MKKMIQQLGMKKTIILAAATVCLIVLSIPWPKTKKNDTKEEQIQETENKSESVEQLENRLVEILSHVDGVGKVQVMITLKSSKESVVNKDTPYEKEEETDGKSHKSSVSRKEETVLVDQDGDRAPYVVKELEPEIEGVVVIAEGGANATVQKNISDAVSALFAVSVNKVKVLKMEDDS